MRVLVIALLFFFQLPPTEQDDPNPEWPGQKMACNNFKNNAHKCQCALATDCDAHKRKDPYLGGDDMMPRCKTYCRRDHCHCISPCTS